MSLFGFIAQLDVLPNAVETDLAATVEYIDILRQTFGTVRHDVYVDRAVIELTNESGYPVGHIAYDSEADLCRFIPHHDDQKKEA